MRAWMYQLNAERDSVFVMNGREVPTTAANTRRELRARVVGPWTCHQFFADVRRGDPLLIKIGGREATGVVALGRIHSAGRGEDGDPELRFTVDRAATTLLERNPIPVNWIRRNVPTSRRNLVNLEPV